MHPQMSQVAGKRTTLLATFERITAFSESCSHQFYSMSSIGKVPPDSSGDACFILAVLEPLDSEHEPGYRPLTQFRTAQPHPLPRQA